MAIAHCELVVRGGTIVARGRQEIADVGVRDGRIAQIGGAMTGAEEIDAHGLLVIPGGIDAHVHLVCAALAQAADEPIWVDDFWTGSLAAIAGGVTTVGNMTFALPGESMTAAIAREMAGASTEAAVDWFLHPVLAGLGDGTAAEIARLAQDGHTSIKVFLSNPDYAAGTPGLADAIAAAGRAGSMTLLHCEDAGMLERAGRELIASGHGAVCALPQARPLSAEVEAVDQAIDLARQTGAPVYIVHLSSAAALGRCRRRVGGGACLRGNQAAVPPPDPGAIRRAGRGQVRGRAAAAGPVRPRRAVERASRGRDRYCLQRSRAVEACRQARPGAGRDDGAARRRRSRNAHADAVLRRRRGRADLAGPVR